MNNQAKFTFDCPHCGQSLEAEADWVGLECDCIYCGKPLVVPKPERAKGRLLSSADSAYREDAHCPADAPKTPSRAPVITVMSRPNPIDSEVQSQHQTNKANFRKRIPKWAYCASCVAVLVIVGFVSILPITGRKRNDDMHSSAKNIANSDDSSEKKLLPRPDIKPIKTDKESARWILSCEEADWKEVMRFPEKNKDKAFFLQGKISSVHSPDSNFWVGQVSADVKNHLGNIWIMQNDDWDTRWLIVYDDERTTLPIGNMLEGDIVSVFGTFGRVFEWTGKNKFNATVTGKTPIIRARLISNKAPAEVKNDFRNGMIEKKYRKFGDENEKLASSEKLSEAMAVYDLAKMVNATLAELYDDNANLIGDVFKTYDLLEKQNDKGFQQAEVAIAHLLWVHEEVRNAKFGHSAMWLTHLQQAAKVLNSPLAKSEYGFFLINRSLGDMGRGNREEGWKLIQTAAKEGSISAKTFVEMINEQMSSSHLSLDYLLQINGNNEDVLEPLMKQCCLELRMEFLRLQKECALRLKELMSDD